MRADLSQHRGAAGSAHGIAATILLCMVRWAVFDSEINSALALHSVVTPGRSRICARNCGDDAFVHGSPALMVPRSIWPGALPNSMASRGRARDKGKHKTAVLVTSDSFDNKWALRT